MRRMILMILAIFFIVSCTQPEPIEPEIWYFNTPFDSITPKLLLDSGFVKAKSRRLFYPEQQDSGWICEYYKEWSIYIMHILDSGDTVNRFSINIKYKHSDDENN